jgi:hypothetical protein
MRVHKIRPKITKEARKKLLSLLLKNDLEEGLQRVIEIDSALRKAALPADDATIK